jgi:hypothetical protein
VPEERDAEGGKKGKGKGEKMVEVMMTESAEGMTIEEREKMG